MQQVMTLGVGLGDGCRGDPTSKEEHHTKVMMALTCHWIAVALGIGIRAWNGLRCFSS